MKHRMKFNKKSGLYTGSNVSFDQNAIEARSWQWWIFVKAIGGQVVFNNYYYYSSSTCKHQHRVRNLMSELGIEIDLTIEAPEGLQDLSAAIEHYREKSVKLEAEINAPRSQAKKNEERRAAQLECQRTIDTIMRLMKKAKAA